MLRKIVIKCLGSDSYLSTTLILEALVSLVNTHLIFTLPSGVFKTPVS